MSVRVVELEAAAAKAPLLFHRLQGREELGRPFRYELEVLSEKPDLAISDLLGTGVTVTLARQDGSRRHLHGLVARAEFLGMLEESGGDLAHSRYRLLLVPWLWFLGRRRDCQIFQEKDTPAILGKVLDRWPIADYELALEGAYRPREYCVQYRESDLDFVSRLAEDEGITFFFRHRAGGHTLVLIDGPGPCAAQPGYERIPYFPPRARARRERDHVDGWLAAAEVRSGKAALEDFDFEKPRTDLLATDGDPRPHPLADSEIYDYPGNYRDLGAGDAVVRLRLEEELTGQARASGSGNASGLACGARFTLEGHPRAAENRAWLVVATDIELSSERYRSGLEEPESEPFRCRFEVHDLAVPWRPPRRTPRPFVHGPQTAIVTGPAGEEIHCDRYGRVKVKFHWDRGGQEDDTSSCWLRVSQAWAGAGFGAMHVPRIGQEVIVDFLEGDPDRPLVTGRVYNALAMPPWGLPGNATQSGIKSNSSKGGGGSNELRFEDKKGAEQVWLHAQKDEDIVVENDKTEQVKHDETITIGNDRTESVGHDETLSVGNDRTRKVGGNETVSVDGEQKITVGKSRTDTVKSSENRTVHIAQKQKVGGLRSVQVGAKQSHTIGANDSWRVIGGRTVKIGRGLGEDVGKERKTKIGTDDSLEVGGARTGKIGKDDALDVQGNRSTKIAKDRTTEVGAGDTLKVGKDLTIKIGKGLAVDAGEQVVIKTGSAAIAMKKDGTITITGKDVTIDASGKITLKAGGNVVIKGQKIEQN